MRYREHQLSGANTTGAQCQLDRVGAAAGADRVADPEPSGKRRLERLDLLPEDVLAARQYPGDRGIDLGLLLEIAGTRIGLRDRSGCHHKAPSSREGRDPPSHHRDG